MSDSRAVEDFSLLLRQLKERTGRSYEALARRANISRSALHRYCSGAAVPPEFDVVNRLGRACGATREELLELHRRWAVASAVQSVQNEASAAPVSPAPVSPAPTSPATAPTGARPMAAVAEAERAGGSAVGVMTDPESTADTAEVTPDGPQPAPVRHRRWWESRRLLFGVVALALLGLAGVITAFALRPSGLNGIDRDSNDRDESRLLLSKSCGDKISMGQFDQCVREVQRLLKASGTQIDIDGAFGPQTLRKVTAFQMLAGLPPTGYVDDATKRALYSGKVSMATWPKARVESRIRQVFVEEPDLAVRVAQCASFLDPVYVLPNTDGSRNWGVFQLSDDLLAKHHGTRQQAFDPEWNIKTAHAAWAKNRDFRDWEHCEKAAESTPSTPAAASGSASPTPSRSPSTSS